MNKFRNSESQWFWIHMKHTWLNRFMLTFRSCHEAEGGNPVIKTAWRSHINSIPHCIHILWLKSYRRHTYHDSQNASEYHGYCHYHYNCYSDPLMMNVLAHHVQVQPLRADIKTKNKISATKIQKNKNKKYRGFSKSK